jgi:hypothetical protein
MEANIMNIKKPASDKERVEIWNTLFSYAYSAAAEMKRIPTAWKSDVGKLSDEDSLKISPSSIFNPGC